MTDGHSDILNSIAASSQLISLLKVNRKSGGTVIFPSKGVLVGTFDFEILRCLNKNIVFDN